MAPEAPAVTLGGAGRIALADLVAVAEGAPVRLDPALPPLLRRAREQVETALAADRPVYGLTTGLGAAVDTRLAPEDVAAFQARAVRARAVAVGERLGREEIRATLFCRLAGLARGHSGISPPLVEAVAACLNRRLHPQARRTGPLGEADLAVLAGLFLPFAGDGLAEFEGEMLPGPEALRRAGIAPPRLGPKDGLALINASAFSTALAGFAARDLATAIEASWMAGALSLEAFRANLSPIDPRLDAVRAAPGQAEGARRLRALLDGSDLWTDGAARRVQDPLSFRCLAPVAGFADLRLAQLVTAVEAELNGAGDSPAVLPETGALLSTVHFDTTALALALEACGQAVAQAAVLSSFRIVKLMSPGVSDLPRFLTRHGGSRTGFATGQKTAAALEAEIRRLAAPVGALTVPVADGVEDYAPMTSLVAEKTRTLAGRMTRLAAVELVVAAQAVEMREGVRLGRGAARALDLVRRHVAPLDEDRPTGEDFERLAVALEAGALKAL